MQNSSSKIKQILFVLLLTVLAFNSLAQNTVHPVTTPIKADNKEAITNLQSALVFLLGKQIIKVTADELSALQKLLSKEQMDARYGEATTRLVADFQKQYGVNDVLGTVGTATAAKLNEVLKGLGAITFNTSAQNTVHSVTTPIKADNKEAITNLQSALIFLLGKQIIKVTADELSALQKLLSQEQMDARYGEATTRLVTDFQKQYGVDDLLGTVGTPTASKLNEVLKGLGFFDQQSEIRKRKKY